MKDGHLVVNQPAGHLENNESIIEAVIRETYEETGWHVQPEYYLGLSRYISPNDTTYLRFSIVVTPLRFDENAKIDPDITDTLWLTLEEISTNRLRSPIVKTDFEKYFTKAKYPLDAIKI